MSLSQPVLARKKIHNRSIQLEGWRREDGLWDIEGRLVDTKDHDYTLGSGVRKTGDAVHDMQVRITIDHHFNVRAAEACSNAVPYPGCESIAPKYQQLVGLNLMHDFRRKVHELFGSIKGCSHITELLMVMPAVAFQTFASDLTEDSGFGVSAKPFPLDKCHALETTTEVVRLYYPKWYRGDLKDEAGEIPATNAANSAVSA